MPIRNWGLSTDSWFNPAAWIETLIPDGADDVFINGGDVTISGATANASSVQLTGPAALNVNDNFSVTNALSVGSTGGAANVFINGGTTNAGSVFVGGDGLGFVRVSGSGLLTSASILVGGAEPGTLSVTAGGTVSSTNPITISSGGAVVFGGTAGAAATGTLNAAVNFGNADSELRFFTTNDASYAGAISGIGIIRVNSAGQVVTLSGANTHSGQTIINGGSTLRINSNLGTGNVANDGVLQLNGGAPTTYGGVISGTGALSVTGAGPVTLTGNHSYAGATNVTSANLNVGNGGASGSLGTGDINLTGGQLLFDRSGADYTVANTITGNGIVSFQGAARAILTANSTRSASTLIEVGASLQVGNGGATGSLGTGGITNNGTLTLNRTDGLLNISGNISGTGSVVVSGGNFTYLTANNTYSGTTTIDAFTECVVGLFGGISGTFGTGDVVNNGAIFFGRGNDEIVSNFISGSGSLHIYNGGVTTLVRSNSYTGITEITQFATLQIGNGGTIGQLGTGAVTNHGLLHFNRSGAQYTITSAINGSGNVQFSGNAIAGISGNNSYTGTTTINSGSEVHVFTSVGSGGSLGTGAIIDNGKLAYFVTGVTHTVGSVISGTGSLAVTGPFFPHGRLILTGNNSYAGQTEISNSATLQIGNGGTTGTLGTGAVINNGTLDFNRAGTSYVVNNSISGIGGVIFRGQAILDSAAITHVGITSITLGSSLYVVNAFGSGNITNNGLLDLGGTSRTVAGEIRGEGSLISRSNLTNILTGNNTYTGTTHVWTGGTLQIGNGGTTGSLGTGDVTIDGTLVYNRSGSTPLTNILSGNGSFIVNMVASSPVFNLLPLTVAAGSALTTTVNGTSGNDTIIGNGRASRFNLINGGNDTLIGGTGNEVITVGAALTTSDNIDGGAGNDQVGITGDYSGANALVLGATTLTNVEVLALLPGAGNSYTITSNDGTVAAGVEMTIFAGNLGAGQNFDFNGSAETNGFFRTFGGLGVDTITGGALSDGFYFGPDKWQVSDGVSGGGGTNDQLALDGNYTVTIGASADVEVLVLLAGPSGTPNSFNITLSDAWTASGATKTVFGRQNTLGMTINGAAETNGSFVIFGGRAGDTLITGGGTDTIYGLEGNDTIIGGAGSDTAVYQGTRATYSVVTGGGSVQIIDNDAVTDGDDGTDTVVGIEFARFSDQTISITSPIILDLDGGGVETLSAGQSNAAFDMDGDGIGDDTSWFGGGEGLLFLDRDGNGTLSNAGEMSFTGDVANARSDLEGLAAFDSNGDGQLSKQDTRFNEFKIWQDRDGDGVVSAGEVMSLRKAGVRSLSLTGTANNASYALGDTAVVNHGSFTRTNGRTGGLVDAVLTAFSSAQGATGQRNVAALSHDNSLSAMRDALAPDTGWLDESFDRRVTLMRQDMASFGASDSGAAETDRWRRNGAVAVEMFAA